MPSRQRAPSSLPRALLAAALELSPYIAAIAAFVGGATMVASAATRGVAERLHVLANIVPIVVIELSHFSASVIGLMLMLLGSGLWARRQGALWTAVLLLLIGSGLSLSKGLEYEEAAILGGLALLLVASRRAFDRPSRMFSGRVRILWLAAAAAVLVSAALLGFWSYSDVIYTDELWWTFMRDGDAARSLRAGVALAGLTVALCLWLLFSTPTPRTRRPTCEELDRAQALIDAHGPADARIWLTGDKDLLFSDAGDAVLAFRIRRRHWIALGGPVGEPEAARDLLWRFIEMADRAGGRALVYAAPPDLLPTLAAMGFILRQVGETPVVDTGDFSLTGKARQNLRTACNRARDEGFIFEVLPAGSSGEIWPDLQSVSENWLSRHAGAEKAFSMGFLDPPYLARMPIAVVRKQGRLVAFANVLVSGDGREAGIDLMRYSDQAPSGVMDFLLVSLIDWAKDQSIACLDLGMTPLSGLENRRLAPLFSRIGALAFTQGGALYGFEGLHAYKSKFGPRWRPLCLAGRPGTSMTLALLDVALLTGRGWRGVFFR